MIDSQAIKLHAWLLDYAFLDLPHIVVAYAIVSFSRTGGKVALGVGALIEGTFAARDILKARSAKKSGKLSQREFEDVVGTRVAVGIGDVSFATAGTIAGGSMIGPLGAAVGGMAGGALGSLLGAAAGKIGVTIRNHNKNPKVPNETEDEDYDDFIWNKQLVISDKNFV